MKSEILKIPQNGEPARLPQVRDIVDLRDKNVLAPDLEYQRGAVWKPAQMRMLIDSVMRGYRLPLFYFRLKTQSVLGSKNVQYDIIDGQQRVNALWGFYRGVIVQNVDGNPPPFPPLFDPGNRRDAHMFPDFIRELPSPDWAGKSYAELPSEVREWFLDREVDVVLIECDDNEARDLFIRLQGGLSLNSQEKRDPFPGNFSHLVWEHGGGKPILGYHGHQFFPRLLKAKPRSDRGKTRTLVAQILMLHLARAESGPDVFVDTKLEAIDAAYRRHVKIALDTPTVLRFKGILDKLLHLLDDGTHPKLQNHDVIHAVMFVDTLMTGNYTSKWENAFPDAFSRFAAGINSVRNIKILTGEEDSDTKDFWHYRQMTSNKSDLAATIRSRHEIYVRQMTHFLGDALVQKDPTSAPSTEMKKEVYYQQEKCCQWCKKNGNSGETVRWDDANFHHIKPLAQGGRTTVDNLALMHEKCHQELHNHAPNGVAEFQEWWSQNS